MSRPDRPATVACPERGGADASGAVSLCLCTYNDHDLLDGLLAGLTDWSRQPDEIIVVDDGSARPYVLPEGLIPQARLIRLEQNSGPAVAKSTALEAGSGEYLLLVDADMRLHPSWLALTLPKLATSLNGRPVGLAGAPGLDEAGSGLVGRYMAAFCGNARPDGPTDFLPGTNWLMLAQVWRQVRGLAGFHGRTHEDHHFCGLVRQAGYALLSIAPAARQVRLLSRTALAARFLAWTAPMRTELVAALRRSGQPARELTGPLALSLMAALPGFFDQNIKQGQHLFVYLEMLIFISLAHDLVRALDPALAASLPASLLWLLRPYPGIHARLAADMTRLGLTWSAEEPNPSDQVLWLEALFFLKPLQEAGFFSRMEEQAGLLDQEKPHFSFYEP